MHKFFFAPLAGVTLAVTMLCVSLFSVATVAHAADKVDDVTLQAAIAAYKGKTLVNGIDVSYPPFGYVDEKGKATGFDVESMNWIANKMGFTIKHSAMAWDGIIPSLLGKKIDMICSGMSITPARSRVVTFADVYWKVEQVIITKTESSLTIEEIMGGKYKLGVQSGTSQVPTLKQLIKEHNYPVELRYYDSAPLTIADVLNGRIDAAAMDSLPAEDGVAQGKAVKIIGSYADPEDFGIATRKEDEQLRLVLNEGHRLLMADPYWEELKTKYLRTK